MSVRAPNLQFWKRTNQSQRERETVNQSQTQEKFYYRIEIEVNWIIKKYVRQRHYKDSEFLEHIPIPNAKSSLYFYLFCYMALFIFAYTILFIHILSFVLCNLCPYISIGMELSNTCDVIIISWFIWYRQLLKALLYNRGSSCPEVMVVVCCSIMSIYPNLFWFISIPPSNGRGVGSSLWRSEQRIYPDNLYFMLQDVSGE